MNLKIWAVHSDTDMGMLLTLYLNEAEEQECCEAIIRQSDDEEAIRQLEGEDANPDEAWSTFTDNEASFNQNYYARHQEELEIAAVPAEVCEAFFDLALKRISLLDLSEAELAVWNQFATQLPSIKRKNETETC